MSNSVYECINITNVINKLKLNKTNQIGSNIYVNCPFCQKSKERNGYMKINTIKNLYICDNCESSGTSIELYAKMKFISTKDAYKELLKEMPVLDNIPYIYNNPIKDEYYRDIVYSAFLDMQQLSDMHREKLKTMGFTDEYIETNNFKSIENRRNKKKEICRILQEQGMKLDGIPGFLQDTDFKWTYKSHDGIFIPVVFNNKIQGLRIWLDKKYRGETENIWFSSSSQYNGTKANNWPMILNQKSTNWGEMYNSKNTNEVIIATEMILAHKLYNQTKKIVIGIPNNIEKDIILNIVKRLNVSEVSLYIDKYTIAHTTNFIFQNVIDVLEKEGIKVNFRVALIEKEEPQNIDKRLEIKIA